MRALRFLLPALLAAASSTAHAQVQPAPPGVRDFTSVRAQGMGGAARGFASTSEALFVNPAGIAGTLRFNLDATGLAEPQYGTYVFNTTAIDSKINSEENVAVSGGFSYTYFTSGKDTDAASEKRKGSVVAAALALPLWPETFFVGVTGRYLRLSGAVESSAITGDVGLLYKPLPNLGLAAVGQNLIDIRNPEAQRSWNFGIALGSDADFHIAFDTRLENDAAGKAVPTFFAGAEYMVIPHFMPRGGYTEDRLRGTRYVNAGFSIIVNGFALDASYRYDLNARGVDGNVGGFGLALRLLDPF